MAFSLSGKFSSFGYNTLIFRKVTVQVTGFLRELHGGRGAAAVRSTEQSDPRNAATRAYARGTPKIKQNKGLSGWPLKPKRLTENYRPLIKN